MKTHLDFEYDPGSLDRRIVIEQRTTGQDSFGQEIDAFNTISAVWAKKEYTGGQEGESAGQILGSEQVTFVVRHLSVSKKNRVVDSVGTYDIESVQEIGRGRFLKLVCKLVDSNPI